MKKIFTLIACLAVMATAVAVNPVREVKAAPAKLQRIATLPAQSKVIENGVYGHALKSDAVGKPTLRAPRATDGDQYVALDSAYTLPINGFHSYPGWYGGQFGYAYWLSLYPAYSDVTFTAQNKFGDTWEYFTDPWDDDQPLLASGKELTYQAPFGGHTLSVDHPYLTQNGDSIYLNTNSLHHGGSAEVHTSQGIDSDLMGHMCLGHPIVGQLSIYRPATKDNEEWTQTNSLWTEAVKEAGIADSAQIVAIAEYFPKLDVPYTVSKMNVTAYVEIPNAKGATFTAKILAFDPETGAYDLDNPLAEASYKFKRAVDWSPQELQFKFTHYVPDPEDPEWMLEETGPMVIDQDILVVFEFDDPNILEFRPLMAAADYNYDDLIPEYYPYALLDLYEGEGEDAELTGKSIASCSTWAWAKEGDASYYRPFSICLGMDIEFPVLEGDDKVVVPAEGGEVTIELNSTTESSKWEVTELPDWFEIGTIDYMFHYQNSEDQLYTGSTELTFTADALPEGETSRSYDMTISFLGAEKTIKVVQGEVAPEYAKGDVNGDGAVGAADIGCLVNVLAGLEDEAIYEGRADVTGDGAVSATDIAAIVNILAGLE